MFTLLRKPSDEMQSKSHFKVFVSSNVRERAGEEDLHAKVSREGCRSYPLAQVPSSLNGVTII